MAKFRVHTTAMALVEQVHIVEADHMETARAKALEPALHATAKWVFCVTEEGTIACDDVEEI